MNQTPSPFTMKWLLFGFKGRIGRKSFILAALLLLMVQLALISEVVGANNREDPDSAITAILGLALLGSWVISAWALLALTIKRLHDLSLPIALSIILLIPPFAYFAWLYLACAASKQETNKHGPVPFPKD